MAQGLEMWLTQYPQPRPPRETWESDPIFNGMQQAFAATTSTSPEFMGIHYMDATTVEECWRLLRQTGKSNSYESLANLPRYSQWLRGRTGPTPTPGTRRTSSWSGSTTPRSAGS